MNTLETANLTLRDAILSGCILRVTPPNGRKELYKFEHVEARNGYPENWFVRIHDGQWAFLGVLDTFTSSIRTTPKSCMGDGHYCFTLISRILARIWCNDEAAYQQHGYRVEALGYGEVLP